MTCKISKGFETVVCMQWHILEAEAAREMWGQGEMCLASKLGSVFFSFNVWCPIYICIYSIIYTKHNYFIDLLIILSLFHDFLFFFFFFFTKSCRSIFFRSLSLLWLLLISQCAKGIQWDYWCKLWADNVVWHLGQWCCLLWER